MINWRGNMFMKDEETDFQDWMILINLHAEKLNLKFRYREDVDDEHYSRVFFNAPEPYRFGGSPKKKRVK